ncbi:MAG: hypothetical protein IT306_28420 [Chloroflexi bacterium]|nr:hypothetical protein [Chloroflexota bacterium]
MPRGVVIVAWSLGLAGLYALLSLLHAALFQQILTVDVGFGRSFAFWIGSLYLLLLGWGFVPRTPNGWYARRLPTLAALGVGLAALAVCGTYTALGLAARWTPAVGGPVSLSVAVLIVAAGGVVWLADREDRIRGS